MTDKENFRLVLAPMAGITDRAFRTVARRHGASFCVSEMVSAKAIHFGDKKTATLADCHGEKNIAIQIFGSEPEIMAEAAGKLSCGDFGSPDMIDINMGCPMKKIVSNGEGSALMKDPELIYKIVSAVSRAATLPVGVKIRTGWDSAHINAPECALAALDGGASVIAVHGRTREQLYAPPVDYETIAEVKSAIGTRAIVIGNGGICDAASAVRMLECGVDGLMIGQGALGRPWIFDEISAALSGKEFILPSIADRIETAKEHMRLIADEKGEYAAVHEGRRHLMHYVKGMRGAAEFRGRICLCERLEDVIAELEGMKIKENTQNDRT